MYVLKYQGHVILIDWEFTASRLSIIALSTWPNNVLDNLTRKFGLAVEKITQESLVKLFAVFDRKRVQDWFTGQFT
jgi:hypothetical protein